MPPANCQKPAAKFTRKIFYHTISIAQMTLKYFDQSSQRCIGYQIVKVILKGENIFCYIPKLTSEND